MVVGPYWGLIAPARIQKAILVSFTIIVIITDVSEVDCDPWVGDLPKLSAQINKMAIGGINKPWNWEGFGTGLWHKTGRSLVNCAFPQSAHPREKLLIPISPLAINVNNLKQTLILFTMLIYQLGYSKRLLTCSTTVYEGAEAGKHQLPLEITRWRFIQPSLVLLTAKSIMLALLTCHIHCTSYSQF